MSWDSYIDKLKAPGKGGVESPVEEAAICGIGIGAESVWATSPGWSITPEEIKVLGASDRTPMRQKGPCISGVKCMLLTDNTDNDQCLSMNLKTSKDADGNCVPICIGRSIQTIIVARGKKDAQPGLLSSRVFDIVKYLKECGF